MVVKWGYDANIMKFFGPTGQSNIRDHAKALNFDLCQARREDHQVCESMQRTFISVDCLNRSTDP